MMEMYIFPILVIGLIIWVKKNQSKWYGAIGERRVRKEIEKLERRYPGTYHSYHDLYIPISDGTYSQIDHLIISEYGLFVLETKFYDGWIFGSENQKNWTQVIYKRKEKFLNPIWQNKGHIRALKELLGEEGENIPTHSIIVFFKTATFKNSMKFEQADVIYLRDLMNTITLKNTKIVNTPTVESISRKLSEIQEAGTKDKKTIAKQHVKNIKAKQSSIKQKVNQNICPRCGEELKLRNGKYGKFKGCNNFPKCRFVEKGA
ncbi:MULTISPECIES: NERD domain-containing protein [Bacillus]|uniref:NERD domain-containing protein n=1 Tax=Bacillus TaxID=1386 RepID=UPI000BB95FDD|nr:MULTISPECIES: NERD domain-containing protein [Bacillus]